MARTKLTHARRKPTGVEYEDGDEVDDEINDDEVLVSPYTKLQMHDTARRKMQLGNPTAPMELIRDK